MAGTTEVLQEYLVKLGFAVESVTHKKMTDALSLTAKKILGVAEGVAGMAVAVEAGVAAFAYQMEKMYYASKLTNTSVAGLMSVKYAGEQVGIAGDAMQGAIHGMAQAMRLNPGLQGLIESFGIKVTGRDVSDVMLDYVRALKAMPEYVGAQYAGLFGIDPDTYHLMVTQLDTLADKQKTNLDLMSKYGLNADQAAATMKNYANELRNVENRVEILGMTISTKLAPEFKWMTEKVNSGLDWLIKGWSHPTVGGGGDPGSLGTSDSSGTSVNSSAFLFKNLENKYNLPEGILDSMWLQESGRGKNMTSKKGAMGHFQFMPGTARHYGVVDPNDLTQSATGAAQYLHDLLIQSHGNVGAALSGYNWGKTRTTGLPDETYGYDNSIIGRLGKARLGGSSGGGVQVHQQTTIHVHGSGDPKEAGKAVTKEQSRVNGDLVRNLHGLVIG